MVKEVTNPCLSPSRAVVPARERAKRRQGRMRAGLLSNEKVVIRSAEVVSCAEGYTDRTAKVRSGRALRCRRTQARMYDRSRDLGDLCVTAALASRSPKSRQKSRAEDARRREVGPTHSSEEAGEQSTGCRVADSVERRGRRNGSVWQAKHGPDTGPEDAPGAMARRRTARATGACASRPLERGAVTTGARSRMR